MNGITFAQGSDSDLDGQTDSDLRFGSDIIKPQFSINDAEVMDFVFEQFMAEKSSPGETDLNKDHGFLLGPQLLWKISTNLA